MKLVDSTLVGIFENFILHIFCFLRDMLKVLKLQELADLQEEIRKRFLVAIEERRK